MLQYQQHHLRVQPENSQPWTWPLMLHPIQYYRATVAGSVHTIVALGDPVLWWGFLALLPIGMVASARRATWREAFIFGGYLAMYLPWFLVPRSQFFSYMLPAVPFMCLGVTAVIRSLPGRWAFRSGIGIAAGSVLAAAAFAPVWTGWGVPVSWVRDLRLLPGWPL